MPTFHDHLIRAGQQCPECGTHDTEDNGGTEYRCVACDHRWGIDAGEGYGYDGYDDDTVDDDRRSNGPTWGLYGDHASGWSNA